MALLWTRELGENRTRAAQPAQACLQACSSGSPARHRGQEGLPRVGGTERWRSSSTGWTSSTRRKRLPRAVTTIRTILTTPRTHRWAAAAPRRCAGRGGRARARRRRCGGGRRRERSREPAARAARAGRLRRRRGAAQRAARGAAHRGRGGARRGARARRRGRRRARGHQREAAAARRRPRSCRTSCGRTPSTRSRPSTRSSGARARRPAAARPPAASSASTAVWKSPDAPRHRRDVVPVARGDNLTHWLISTQVHCGAGAAGVTWARVAFPGRAALDGAFAAAAVGGRARAAPRPARRRPRRPQPRARAAAPRRGRAAPRASRPPRRAAR